MFARALLFLIPTVLLGCTTTTDPSAVLSVTGTVTHDGAPAPATVVLTAGNFSSSRFSPDGTYSLTVGGGGIPASNCASASVQATLHPPDDDETVLDQEVRHLGACGEHVVDFTFD